MSSWVEYRLNPNLGRVVGASERTLLQLLRNAVTIVLVTLAIMLALSQLGINTAPLLAGAGVGGPEVRLRAPELVQEGRRWSWRGRMCHGVYKSVIAGTLKK